MRTKLSVNINKIATIRNARGGNNPNLIKVAKDCEAFGADGITVHPRPDERHVRRADVPALRAVVRTEFNIEGYPSKEFLDLVLRVRPSQVTLVPDKPGQLTSDNGWDTEKEQFFLRDVLGEFVEEVFVNSSDNIVLNLIECAIVEDTEKITEKAIFQNGVVLGENTLELCGLLLNQLYCVIDSFAHVCIVGQIQKVIIACFFGKEDRTLRFKIFRFNGQNSAITNRSIFKYLTLYKFKSAICITQEDKT